MGNTGEDKAKEPFEIIRARHYADAFSGESGEFVLQDLLAASGMLSDGFSTERGVTDFNAGKRNIVSYIISKLQLNELNILARSKMDTVINKEFQKSLDYDEQQSGYERATFQE